MFDIDNTGASSHILLHFFALLLLLLLLYIFHPLKPSDTVKFARNTGKVVGMGWQLGGARRGRILTAGEFQPTQ